MSEGDPDVWSIRPGGIAGAVQQEVIMEVRQRIKELRKARGLSQEELAHRMGYKDRSTIAKIERGVNDISQSKIEAFARALDATPSYLMGWDEHTPSESDEKIPGLMPYRPSHRIPVLGRISAGLPIYSEENIEGYIYTDLDNGGEYFALRVTGDSMDLARIYEGDLLIVRRQEIVEQGEIAVVMVGDDEATVKRFYQTNSVVTLLPESTNPKHKPQVYDLAETAIRILGKVVKVEFLVR